MAEKRERPIIIGHRGSCGVYPENTLLSFRRGLAEGAEMFELDVRLSRDGVPVVMHDDVLARIAGRPGKCSTRTWKHLSRLDVGSWRGEEYSDCRLTTIEEMFREFAPQVPLNLELKVGKRDPAPLIAVVARVLSELGLTRRILVSSFCHEALPLLEAQLPGVMTAYLIDDKQGPLGQKDLDILATHPLREEIDWQAGLPFRGRILCLNHHLATEEFVKAVRELGGGVLCWTVNEPEDMLRLASYGVTGIMSNYPALLKQTLLDEYGA